MKKLIILGVILVIIAAVLAFFGVRAVTATPDIEVPVVILEIDEGGVEVWPADGNTWERVRDGHEISTGDRVRTLDSSAASIIFFDNSVMRLDENTEITLTELHIDSENYLDQDVDVELLSGRVWSRIMNLLDLDSTYEVETSSVVATVRGTAFSMSVGDRGETEVDVTESQVALTMFKATSDTGEIIKTNPKKINIGAGQFIKRGPTKNTKPGEFVDIANINPQQINEERLKSNWYLKNIAKDEDFAQRVWNLRRDKLRKYIKSLPGSPFFGLQRMGEKFGLAFSGEDKKENLQNLYIARRISEVAELAHQGNAGLASQELIQFENSLKLDGTENKERLMNLLPNLLYYHQGFWADVLPQDSAYRLKQKIEAMGLERNISPEKIIYWKLINLENRLTEAQRLIIFQDRDIVTNVLEAARLGLENLQTEAEALPNSEEKKIILEKIEYDLKKFGLIQEEINLLEYQAPELLQNQDEIELIEEEGEDDSIILLDEEADGAVTEPEDTEAPVEPPPEEPAPPEEKVIEYLTIGAFPNPVLVGGSSDLSAQAHYTDGTNEDVTGGVDWVVYGAVGSISGGVFYAGDAAGSAQIEGTYSSGGATKGASFLMTVKEEKVAVTLSHIGVSATKTNLNGYDTSTIYVTAYYSDDTSRDVTGSSGLSNSNPEAGYLSGNVFSAYPADSTTTITATYSEDGVTKNNNIVLTVTY